MAIDPTEIQRLSAIDYLAPETADTLREDITNADTPRDNYEDRPSVNETVVSPGSTTPTLEGAAALPGVSTTCGSGRDVRYGQAAVTETLGGHQIILNDTMGSETILIRHSSGSGIEIRPDGSVLISGSQVHFAVQGNANFAVDGNANFQADGNLNFRAGGGIRFNASEEISMTTSGSLVHDIGGNFEGAIRGNSTSLVMGASTSTTMGERNETSLGGYSNAVQGDMTLRVDGNGGIYSSGQLGMTAQGRTFMSSPSVSITGSRLQVVGSTGTIGGEGIISYSHNSYVGQTLNAGRTVNTQSVEASRTVRTHTVLSDYVDTQTVNASLNVDTQTVNATKNVDTHTVEASYISTTYGTASTWEGNLEGVAKFSEGSSTYTGPTTTSAETAVEGISPTTAVASDLRQTFLPTQSIIENRQRGLGNGVREVQVDPGNYIRNSIDRTAMTGGNPNVVVDRSPPLPAASGGGTAAAPGGTPIARSPGGGSATRVPAAPHRTDDATGPSVVRGLDDFSDTEATTARDYLAELSTIEVSDFLRPQFIPVTLNGNNVLVMPDYLRLANGTYHRASRNSADAAATLFNARLPTTSEIDAIYQLAKTSGTPVSAFTAGSMEREYGSEVYSYGDNAYQVGTTIGDLQVDLHNRHSSISGIAPNPARIVAGQFKSIFASTAGGNAAGIYGWRDIYENPIQPAGSGGHSADYADYSQAVRLIKEI